MNSHAIERQVTVGNGRKRHVLPAASFVRLMNRFRCDVRVAYNGNEVDGKSVLDLMTLAPLEGTKVWIRIEGPDAAEAMHAVDQLVQSRSDND